jgi:hypothetical protein
MAMSKQKWEEGYGKDGEARGDEELALWNKKKGKLGGRVHIGYI